MCLHIMSLYMYMHTYIPQQSFCPRTSQGKSFGAGQKIRCIIDVYVQISWVCFLSVGACVLFIYKTSVYPCVSVYLSVYMCTYVCMHAYLPQRNFYSRTSHGKLSGVGQMNRNIGLRVGTFRLTP